MSQNNQKLCTFVICWLSRSGSNSLLQDCCIQSAARALQMADHAPTRIWMTVPCATGALLQACNACRLHFLYPSPVVHIWSSACHFKQICTSNWAFPSSFPSFLSCEYRDPHLWYAGHQSGFLGHKGCKAAAEASPGDRRWAQHPQAEHIQPQ